MVHKCKKTAILEQYVRRIVVWHIYNKN